MGLSWVQSRALLGLEAAAVTVEVHLANGLPSFTLVGLADVEVKEARERVRSAILNADWPLRVVEQGGEPRRTPTTAAFLRASGLGEAFVNYLAARPGFMA